mmetsp:Transcript_14001/g.39619  ORF Transcript_14001/g.39619 Transcript_14001/m.39619 type:complete len:85 (+) Transcript_14001:60-314(+)
MRPSGEGAFCKRKALETRAGAPTAGSVAGHVWRHSQSSGIARRKEAAQRLQLFGTLHGGHADVLGIDYGGHGLGHLIDGAIHEG